MAEVDNMDGLKKSAWQTQMSEDFMLQYGQISKEILEHVRYKILAHYRSIKIVELECDPEKATMFWTLKFKFLRGLGKRRKIMKKLHGLLEDRFQEYLVTVKIV